MRRNSKVINKNMFGRNITGRRTSRSKEICIIDAASIAGTAHIDGIAERVKELHATDKLTFKRDRTNVYDEWAVKVFDGAGKRLGFLPLGSNEIVARLLDSGVKVYGKIKRIEERGAWTDLQMKVFLCE